VLSDTEAIYFVGTSRPIEARAFYEGTLGLTLLADEPFALVFSVAGRMLRLAKTQPFEPLRHTVLGWNVADITSAVTQLRDRGVDISRFPGMSQDALGIWQSPSGAKVAWFKDPDGNALSLTEFPRGSAP
jgi:catechol 2,3-dioxygenase-like lactoylglutathione lyase family enzyme